ncbi:hypothetical protein BUE67_15840, partial [Corynebacterium diphtheriae]
MVVTLEPPSAVSVGLCLAHAAGDKRPWLERLGIDAAWPMSGHRRVQSVSGWNGGDLGAALGGVGGVVPGPCG